MPSAPVTMWATLKSSAERKMSYSAPATEYSALPSEIDALAETLEKVTDTLFSAVTMYWVPAWPVVQSVAQPASGPPAPAAL